MDIVILPDAEALAVEATSRVLAEVEAHESLMLGLAGGSTPLATHAALAAAPVDWTGVTAWIPDERWVPPNDPNSNQRMMRETLTDQTGIELLAPDTTAGTPAAAATTYGDLVIPRLTDRDVRSVVMLGMGDDGHTASLFPGTVAEGNDTISYVANFVPQHDTWRLTATLPLLAEADLVLFLVVGEGKASRIAEVHAGEDLPAARVTAKEAVVWLVDEAAASRLS